MPVTRARVSACMLALLGVAVLTGGVQQASAACVKPLKVTISKRSEGAVRVSWRAPRGRTGLTYRVTRSGRVVGQTRGRSMVVRVRPGKRVVIRVGVVGGTGRMRCSVVLRTQTDVLVRADLTAPRKFAARTLPDGTVRLRWSLVPDAFAYRVYRDDLVVKQVQTSTLDIPVVAGRSYRFQVAAVDRSGRVGAMSRMLLFSADVDLPKAPTALAAQPEGAAAYRVSWRASVRGSMPVRGYRVFRDGVVLGQVSVTSYLVTGLEAGLSYRIEVRAVDSRGQVSPPSAPLPIAIDPPAPTTGSGRAFLLASTDRSFEDFQAHYTRIGRIYPTYYDCTAAGALIGRDDPRITRWAQARRVLVMPRVNCQNTQTLHRILTEPDMRGRWIDAVVGLAESNGYDGINLDFEAGLYSDRDAMSSFVTELGNRLHAEGRLLSLDVSSKVNDNNRQHPRSGIFDYPVLDGAVDEVLVMSWGWHWLTSGAGEIAPLSWLRDVAAYTATMPHPERFVMGTSMYGIDWPAGSGLSKPGTALEYVDVLALVARLGVVPQRDPNTAELFFSYTDTAGVHHDVRYHDATTVAAKHQAAASGGNPRTFMWRLGDEDQAVWNLPSMG